MKRLVFITVAPLLFIVSKLPFWLLYQLSNLFYVLIYHIVGYRKNVVRKNLTLCGFADSPDELKNTERKFYRFLCDLFLEAIKVKGMSKKQLIIVLLYYFKITSLSIKF